MTASKEGGPAWSKLRSDTWEGHLHDRSVCLGFRSCPRLPALEALPLKEQIGLEEEAPGPVAGQIDGTALGRMHGHPWIGDANGSNAWRTLGGSSSVASGFEQERVWGCDDRATMS
jgi:hypothetical protein